MSSYLLSLFMHFYHCFNMLALCILFCGKERKYGSSGLVNFILLESEISLESVFP